MGAVSAATKTLSTRYSAMNPTQKPAEMLEVRSARSFDFGSREYRDLFSRSNVTPFQHPIWLDRVYARLAPSAKMEPVVATVRVRSTGRLVAVLPLMRLRQYGLTVLTFADPKVSDYVEPIFDPEIISTADCKALAKSIREALPRFDLWRISKLRADSRCSSALLAAEARTSPMSMGSHAVNLYQPVDNWREENIDRTTLNAIDLNCRRLRRKGKVELRVIRTSEDIHDAFAAMRGYREPRFRRREGEDLLQNPAYFEFYREVATVGVESLSRTYVLTFDGRPIGVCFGLAYRTQFLNLLTGFDGTNFKNYSIGLLLIDGMLRDCIERGERLYDFTVGDEAYKEKFGTLKKPLLEGWVPGSLAGSIALAAKTKLPGVTRFARVALTRVTRGAA